MKVISAYLIFLTLSFIVHTAIFEYRQIVIAFFLYALSFIFIKKIKFRMDRKGIIAGLNCSLYILVPVFLLLLLIKGKINPLSFNLILFLLLGVAIPEELFFRGFIQEKLCNNLKAVIVSSFMFTFAHIPNLLFHRDFYSLLTFFPSFIMGWLYMKTSNLLPSIIFHFLANLVYYLVF